MSDISVTAVQRSAAGSGRMRSAKRWAVSWSASSATGGSGPSCNSIEREKPLSDGGTKSDTAPAPLKRRIPSV